MTHSDGAGTGPDDAPDDAPAGSVAHEASLLLDLLSQRGWAGGSGMPSASSPDPAPAADGGPDRDEHPSGSAPHECTCGGTTPAACRVCPVCQLIAFVQKVDPDTIDTVADFVGFAATALRDLATAQRDRRRSPERGDDSTGGTPEGSS